MGDPKLSIVVITYNQKSTISEALDSILMQQHNYSYEIVIGDDYSVDGTRDILDKYKTKYPDIIKLVFNPENLGVIRNYFNTINHCSGEYIMQCAGDDWWLPGKIQTQIEYMDNHLHCGLSYTDAECVYCDECKSNTTIKGSKDNSFQTFVNWNVIPALTIVARKKLIDKYIGEISPQTRNWKMEDYPMWLWFSANTIIEYLPITTSCYRIVNGSVSHAKTYLSYLNFISSIYDIKNFYIDYYGARFELDKSLVQRLNLEETQIKYQKALLSRNYKSFKIARREMFKKSIFEFNGIRQLVKNCFLLSMPKVCISLLEKKYKKNI